MRAIKEWRRVLSICESYRKVGSDSQELKGGRESDPLRVSEAIIQSSVAVMQKREEDQAFWLEGMLAAWI